LKHVCEGHIGKTTRKKYSIIVWKLPSIQYIRKSSKLPKDQNNEDKFKIGVAKEALPGFEPGISCLQDRRFNR
tara:strand:- start:209 stop:427 length:219 start_codon:yes stop_codon:yes gene_type:complete